MTRGRKTLVPHNNGNWRGEMTRRKNGANRNPLETETLKRRLLPKQPVIKARVPLINESALLYSWNQEP